jgi:hypothetical protein
MNILTFFETLALAGVCAVIGVTYTRILLAEDILHWWLKFGEKHFYKTWLFKPIWGCHKCFAGQMALWLYLVTKFFGDKGSKSGLYAAFEGDNVYIHHFSGYSLIWHIFAICAAILISEVIALKLNKLDQ